MQIRLTRTPPVDLSVPLLVLPIFQGQSELQGAVREVDLRTGGLLSRALAAGDLRGRGDDSLLLYRMGEGGPERFLLLGVGKAEEFDAEGVRRFAARGVRGAERLNLEELAIRIVPPAGAGTEAAAQAAAEGAALAAWDFRELKGKPGPEDQGPSPLVVSIFLAVEGSQDEAEEGVRVGAAVAAGENLARTLQFRPGNVATPSHLAEVAREMAEARGLDLTVLGPRELEADGFHALLSVARGSHEEPRFIILRHRGGKEGDRPLVLVGKGLTFDAGGISIKPAAGMESMKYDMSGGAAVLGAMQAVAELGLPLNVVALVPCTENLLGGGAMKPGDVIRTRAGKTVEVINTDAEGRLILADGLDFARGLDPAAVVDCATLTGACVVALGNHAAAVLGNDEELVEELRGAGERSGERCWPLPMFKEYRKQLDSPVADLQNVGGRPAGTITAAWFLREFAGEFPWAHLDIAGTAYGDTPLPYQRKGGYGFPTRLLVEWLRSRSG